MFRRQNDDVLLGALQTRKQFQRSQVPAHFARENEVADELTKLGSSWLWYL
jgi:hypothetical protein